MSGRAVRRSPVSGYATNAYLNRPITRPKYRTRKAMGIAGGHILAAIRRSRMYKTVKARRARSYRLKKMTAKRKFPGGLGSYMSKFFRK